METLNTKVVCGRAESAPTLDNVESFVQAWRDDYEQEQPEDNEDNERVGSKATVVRFDNRVTFRPIPLEGKGRKTPSRGQGNKFDKGRAAEGPLVGSADRASAEPMIIPSTVNAAATAHPRPKWADMFDEPDIPLDAADREAQHPVMQPSAIVEEEDVPKGIGTGPSMKMLESGLHPTRISCGQEKSGRDAIQGTRSHRYATPEWRPLHWHLEGSSGGIPTGEIACMRIKNDAFGEYHRKYSSARTSSRISRRRSVGGGMHMRDSYIHEGVCHDHACIDNMNAYIHVHNHMHDCIGAHRYVSTRINCGSS